MEYYTVVTVMANGKPTKAYVKCGGTSYCGYTDEKTGKFAFETKSDSAYSLVVEKSGYHTERGTIKGGSITTVALQPK